MAERPPQISITPSDDFAALWSAYREKSASIKVKDWICGGLLLLMSMPPEDRDAWFQIYRMAEANSFRHLPGVELGPLEIEWKPPIPYMREKPNRGRKG